MAPDAYGADFKQPKPMITTIVFAILAAFFALWTIGIIHLSTYEGWDRFYSIAFPALLALSFAALAFNAYTQIPTP